jgi:hypothetical protein
LRPVCFVVTCAGVAAPSSRMAPAKEELDAFDTWLGAEFEGSRGNTIALPEPVKDALAKAFREEAIDFEDDVPEDGTPLSSADITEVVSFFVSAFDDYVADGVPKATSKFKLKAWFQARFGEASDDALFNLNKEGNKTVISSDAAGALKADLVEQGMASPFELFALELAVFLGRPVGESEVAGGTYRAPPSTMAGAVAARKGGSTQTFDTVLAAAQRTGDTVEIEQWLLGLVRLLHDSGSAVDKKISTLIMKFWMETCNNLRQAPMRVAYITDYRKRNVGRGFPVAFDKSLGFAALSTSYGQGPGTPAGLGSFSARTSLASSTCASSSGGSCGYSDLGGSASQMGSSQAETILSKVSEIAGGLKELSDAVKEVRTRVAATEKKLVATGACFHCGSTDHKAHACPEKKKAS